jgi:hypothetical protein
MLFRRRVFGRLNDRSQRAYNGAPDLGSDGRRVLRGSGFCFDVYRPLAWLPSLLLLDLPISFQPDSPAGLPVSRRCPTVGARAPVSQTRIARLFGSAAIARPYGRRPCQFIPAPLEGGSAYRRR